MYSILFWVQASTSVGLIGREASEMSVSPAQNFLKPPPVPEMPIVAFTPGFTFWNSSATASVIGYTVLEPSAVITDDCAAVPGDARPTVTKTADTSATQLDRTLTIAPSLAALPVFRRS